MRSINKWKKYWNYLGNLPQEFVDKCKENDKSVNFELAVYRDIDIEKKVNNDFLIWRNRPNNNIEDLPIDTKEKRDRIYAKHFLMAQTKKFWVQIERDEDWRIKSNESFKKQKEYRDNYFEQLWNDREKAQEYFDTVKKWEDITRFLPETDRNGVKRDVRK